MTRPYLDADKPLPFAHRGGAERWPENTMLAFRGAIDLGYRYIETDVHETADGHFVLFHDATLDRTTDGRGPLKAKTLAQLHELDAGYRFERDGSHPYRGQGLRVPTLEEALAIDPKVRWNLEIKPRDVGVAKRLFDFIVEHRAEDRVLVASESDRVGKAFARHNRGRIATSPGFYGVLDFWAKVKLGVARRFRFSFDALQVPPTHGRLQVVTPSLIEAAHHHGIQVHVWTINSPPQMRELLAIGVDGLMTDVPDVLLRVLAEPRSGFARAAD